LQVKKKNSKAAANSGNCLLDRKMNLHADFSSQSVCTEANNQMQA